MKYKLLVNCNNPPTAAIIASELINASKKIEVQIVWQKEWKGSGNVQLLNEQDKVIAESNNEVNRYLARTINTDLYGGINACERTEVDHWISFAMVHLSSSSSNSALSQLNDVLLANTWLVSKKLTLADIHVFCALRDVDFVEKNGKQYSNISRWYKQILTIPAIVEALASVAKNRSSTSCKNEKPEKNTVKRAPMRKQEGKFIDLPGAEMGKVIVRFPPEASGYLHIGHAKAALLNQYYAEAFQGQLIMRFDDTNPAKENVEFEQAILQDLELLQVKYHRFTHSSDYFDLMLDYCTKLIKDGKAFVDDTPAHIMKEERDQKKKSNNRDNSIEKNLELWSEMQKGTPRGQECCVRAKIDYESANGCMRDPTIYRCKPEPHPRTGTKYKVYPTYDFACPIVDAIEGVTHTLRTTEYHDRDPQFYWITDALGLRRPYIWEYSRLNMTNTVLSKRKLTWFVDQGLVDGWDDPRFPTVRGILRRGMTVEGLKQFIIAQGSSRSVVFMEWDKIWAFNKKVIDPVAIRYTALDYGKTIPVHVMNAKEEFITVQNHPKAPSIGSKQILTSPLIYIEREDAEQLVEGQNATFINWGNLLIQKIEKKDGIATKVIAKTNLENKDYKNTLKLTWLGVSSTESIASANKTTIPCFVVNFDHIISKPVLAKEDDFKDFVAKNTRIEIQMIGEGELKRVKKGEIIQLQRKGYYICDVPYAPASAFSSREQPLILFNIPDGHVTPQKSSITNVTVNTPTKDAVKETSRDKSKSSNADAINLSIIAQGDKVRCLKADKAEKSVIDAAVKILLGLKADYKACTGSDWKPGIISKPSPQPANSTNDKPNLVDEISQQEAKINELEKKLNEEKTHLLNLKNKCAACGTKNDVSSAENISMEIQKQGDKVRQLKSAKANKNIIDQEVKRLLSLKADYKTVSGEEWKPSSKPVEAAASGKPQKPPVAKSQETSENTCVDAHALSEKIQSQGDKVRELKAVKAGKTVIDQEVKILLGLKADYKVATGQEWKPSSTKPAVKNARVNSTESMPNAEKLLNEIQKQGDKVRELKSSKAEKSTIDQEVKILLNLKNDYMNVTGQEWKPLKADAQSKPKKKDAAQKIDKHPNKEIVKTDSSKDADATKTGTRLGLEARKEDNFFEWYSQIITKSGMIEYYDVSGCYILRPWSFAIWKVIKAYIEKEISKLGVQECYFPIFVTRSVLEREKAHIADFAPEVAWVTKCGESDLAEPIAIRPTSETVMYPAYAKWLRSDTELPIRLNQWNNVVRWEFKDPKPFLRTREFLWQEGHTAFATKAEADEEVLIILDIYARVYEDLLAVPVVKGRKTEKEKFAGGDYTTTVEAFISTSGRAIQGATSHHLGQNFSKMFNIQVEGIAGTDEKTFVYQNSWGMTTRTVGVMIMVHGDDKGLVLPPNVACIQAIIVPCGLTANTSNEQRTALFAECNNLLGELTKDSNLRVEADYRSNRTPGWKFNHWELKGVPVRIELGPKDLEKNQVTFVRRDNSQRLAIKRSEAVNALRQLLNEIHTSMLGRARNNLNEHIKQVATWDAFCTELNKKNLLLSPFCGEPLCEDNIKADSAREDTGEEPGALSMGAKGLCIPFEQPETTVPINQQKCIHPDCRNTPKFYTLFGRSY